MNSPLVVLGHKIVKDIFSLGTFTRQLTFRKVIPFESLLASDDRGDTLASYTFRKERPFLVSFKP